MWVLKFRNWHTTCLLRPLCKKYNVTDLVYLINSWKEKGKFYYTELHILQGSSEGKKHFVKGLKKDPSTKEVEQIGDHVFTLNEKPAQKKFYSAVFDERVIQVKPVVQRIDGFEDWELASWRKEALMEILKIPEFEIEIHSIKQEKIKDIFIPHISQKLPPKQKEAIELAVKQGYYNYPRKTDLEKLAKISKVKRQTYQENLRRAESKIVPFLTEKGEKT